MQQLTKGVDFYHENGWVVYTAEYHLKRGYCCHSGCRHCPYGYDDSAQQKPDTPNGKTNDNGNL
ncbi:hypothetical protein F6R98_00250 [Candidatus Methylospira mobilis]|uniref:Uncharacterized protein n=1 Tax=Candidatus Methylospira mobilis TaxID=1808979 RepID=A0A5Q0BBA0_9GAMM|nr:DUF5522 domain-containing protein [Candidatus Methylospira mobilis]QFY41233.1 hypothetical protein F6R98_00250 [Candidatus Methylospira mobilis]WNV05547.1 DUF5522 domain-containing protein [Candidatus Methylospira mobilis]